MPFMCLKIKYNFLQEYIWRKVAINDVTTANKLHLLLRTGNKYEKEHGHSESLL